MPPPENKTHLPFADVVIVIVMAVCFALSVLGYALVIFTNRYVPGMAIALFFGTFLGSLTYRFLPTGNSGEITSGLIKFGGAAAVIIGTAITLSPIMETQNNLLNRLGLGQGSSMPPQTQGQTTSSLSQSSAVTTPTESLVNQVAILSPTSENAIAIRKLETKKVGPWSDVQTVEATTIASVTLDKPGYFITCDPDLKYKTIEVARIEGDKVVNGIVLPLRYAGLISDLQCHIGSNHVEMQIACADAYKLHFTDLVGCRNKDPLWRQTGTLSKLAYTVISTNPH